MSEPLAHDLRVFLRDQKQRGARMPQVIEADARQLSLFKYRAKVTVSKIWDGKRRSLLAAKD